MKIYNDLYDELCSFRNLYLAFKKAKKNKRFKKGVGEFELNLEGELFKLQKELRKQSYDSKQLRKFIIRDPKSRVIHASDFRDRVVHHALVNIIQPIFEPAFIYDSFANQKNKGTHKALDRFDKFKRKVSNNGKLIRNAKYSSQVVGYVLKADIKHYFQTVDHEILLSTIKNKIKDEKVIWLIKKILSNHTSEEIDKGMPLGNLTSQFFANVYLNELDYFIKHQLKAKYYIRYVDDFVLLDRSKQVLEEQMKQISDFLQDKLKLELHPDKSKIFPIYQGTSFLGFRVFYHHRLLKKSNIRHFRRKLKEFEILKEKQLISDDKIQESIDGWLTHADYGNTYKLRKAFFKNSI
ncbi:MAG: hypothetical protein HY831_04800 [Candidatus Aenigmarchaeota archaeon]|nr:hypothetical protein [Candidatus Aenigmarchaeota archaeon]